MPGDAISYDKQIQELTRIGFGLNPRANANEWETHVDEQLFARAPYIELLRALGQTDKQFSDVVSYESYPAFEASGQLKGQHFCERIAFITFDEIILPGAFTRLLRRVDSVMGAGFDPQNIKETEALVDDRGDLVAEPRAEISFAIAGVNHTWTFVGKVETMCADLLSKLRQITDDGPGPRRLYIIELPIVETATTRERGALLIGATSREIDDFKQLCGQHVGGIRRP